MQGWNGIARRDWGWNVRGDGGRGEKTNLELLEPLALVPAALPLLFHPLYGDETLSSPLWTGAAAALHGGQGSIGGEGAMPVAEKDGAKGAVAEGFDGGVGAVRACGGVLDELGEEKGRHTGASIADL